MHLGYYDICSNHFVDLYFNFDYPFYNAIYSPYGEPNELEEYCNRIYGELGVSWSYPYEDSEEHRENPANPLDLR